MSVKNHIKNHLKNNIKNILSKNQIDEIVLVGGSTRIPKIQELLSNFFKQIL